MFRAWRWTKIVLLVFVLTGFFSVVQAQERPNVLIFIADDISYNDFGCYGHPVIKTPNIDQLAQNGLRFTNAFLTTSSCSPSRISILTGRYPHNTGAGELHTDIPASQVLFPQLLKAAGYYTAQAGKWHLGSSGVGRSAFDRADEAGKNGGPSGAEHWVRILQERPKDKPFFMWYAAHDAHRNWDQQLLLKPYRPQEVVVPVYMLDSDKTREDLAAYYKEVSRFDHYVGEAVQELKRQKALDNTLIIVMADNGRPFPRDKTRLYDDGIKTPFIVHWPAGIKGRGKVSESLLSVIDIAPTIAEITGIRSSPAFQGKSFAELLQKPHQEFRNYVFAEHNWHDYQAHERMVRTKKFLYLENGLPESDNRGAIDIMGGAAGVELKLGWQAQRLNAPQQQIFLRPQPAREFYYCVKDSLQLNNLLADEKEFRFADDLNKLAKALGVWKRETADSQPPNLTPDWYGREDCAKLPAHGKRGTMPGADKNAEKVNKSGPF
jgi:N-sulfoglucosamine sulfohydrolase